MTDWRRVSDIDRAKLIRAQIEDPPKGETSLHAFMRLLWPTVETRPFKDGWHLHAKCEALTAVHEGDIKKLIINEPPGSCKSMLCNVIWPAFIWLKHEPGTRMAFASYDPGLVNAHARRFVELLTAPLTRLVFPEFEEFDTNQSIHQFFNSKRGERFGTSVPRGKFTGRHYDGHIYDDLIKPSAIVQGVAGEHQQALREAMRWITETAASRAVDPEALWRVVIAQRLHEADPSGELLAEGDWEHLCFPERYEPNATWIVGDFTAKHDPRKEKGELLWPGRRGEKASAEAFKSLGSSAAVQAQYQQNPAPSTGGVLHKEHFRRWREMPRLLDCQVIASLDLSFKGSSVEQSRVAWQLWAKKIEAEKAFYYLIAGGAEHLSYAQSKAKVRRLKEDPLWSHAQTWLIEDKANGPALMSDLENELGMQAFNPGNTDKVGRMLPFVELVHEQHCVLLPDNLEGEEILDEIVRVPRGKLDDHWDCMSQALAYLVHGTASFKEAYDAWQKIRAQFA